jgi:hypothetical protein
MGKGWLRSMTRHCEERSDDAIQRWCDWNDRWIASLRSL